VFEKESLNFLCSASLRERIVSGILEEIAAIKNALMKRLKSCYAVMLKRRLYNKEDYEYIKSTFEKIKKYLTKNEKNISIYHKMLIDFKLKDDDSSIYKLMNNFNSNFKKSSEKYFAEGVEKNLIY